MNRETSRARWIAYLIIVAVFVGLSIGYLYALNAPNNAGPGPWTVVRGVIPAGATLGNPKCYDLVSSIDSTHHVSFCLWITNETGGWELDGYYDHGAGTSRAAIPSLTAQYGQDTTESVVTPDGTGEILWSGGYVVGMGVWN